MRAERATTALKRKLETQEALTSKAGFDLLQTMMIMREESERKEDQRRRDETREREIRRQEEREANEARWREEILAAEERRRQDRIDQEERLRREKEESRARAQELMCLISALTKK